MTSTPAPTTAVSPPQVQYAPRPALREAAPWDFPTPEIFALDNGLSVQAYDLPGQGLVTGIVSVTANALDDPAGREGLAHLTLSALTEGAGQLDALGFAAAIEGLGATITGQGDLTRSDLGFSAPISRLEGTLEHVTAALTEPRLADADLARLITMQIGALEYNRSDPRWVAQYALTQALNPVGARARTPIGGSRASLAAITPADIRDFCRETLTPDGAVLCIAGDFSGIDLPEMLGSTIGRWSGPTRSATPEPPAQSPGPLFQVVHLPGSVQSQLIVTAPSVTRDHPDWAALEVASHIIGGGPTSTLWERLRDQLGYTYGIGAHLDASAVNGNLTVFTAVESGVSAPALAEITTILDRYRESGFSADQHRRAVNELTAAAPFRAETGAALAALAAEQVTHEVAPDHVATNLAKISASTAESAAAAYQGSIGHDQRVIMIVGDADQILTPLAALGHGEPDVIELEF
ncbi:MAG: pitrilysin family protein [Actinomycetia bacterium]|nr:pitrilysin family protein [Actinomycetes bacterium]